MGEAQPGEGSTSIMDAANLVLKAQKAGDPMGVIAILDGVPEQDREYVMAVVEFKADMSTHSDRSMRLMWVSWVAIALAVIAAILNFIDAMIHMLRLLSP